MINYINGNNQPDAINQNKTKAVNHIESFYIEMKNDTDMNEWINQIIQTIILV